MQMRREWIDRKRPVGQSPRTLLALAFGVWATVAYPQSADVLRQLDDLDRKCEAARDAALPAIRQQKIEACVGQAPSSRAAPRTREECERYWSDYGVMQRQRAALDLPECRKAFEARQQYRSR
jgi:hypothetical protein